MPKLLEGRRVLVVEDEFLAALDLARLLQDLGGEVVGPVGRLSQAHDLAERESLDVAVLDFKLDGETTGPFAQKLRARGVQVVIATGYEPDQLPEELTDLPRLTKPYSRATLLRLAKQHLAD